MVLKPTHLVVTIFANSAKIAPSAAGGLTWCCSGEKILERSIKVITDKKELKGTDYFEIMPGKYKGTCWKDGSIFFDEEVFTLIEPAFERHVPKYDHYAFTDVSKDQWEKILSDLASIKDQLGKATTPSDLRGIIGELFVSTIDNFEC
jgi:hypothetical protein